MAAWAWCTGPKTCGSGGTSRSSSCRRPSARIAPRSVNKLAEAKSIALKGLQVRPAYGTLQMCLYTVAYLERDEPTMARIVQQTSKTPIALDVMAARFRALVAAGRLRETDAQIAALKSGAQASGISAGFAAGAAEYAFNLAMMDDSERAVRAADTSIAMTGSQEVFWDAPSAYVMAGRPQKAAALQPALMKRFARNTAFRDIWLPSMAAGSALMRGDHAAAAEGFAAIERYETSSPSLAVLRGRALLGAGRGKEAAAAFQRALDNRFTVEPTPLGPIATIWLARARAKQGDPAGARRAYQDAFAAWKEADADLPLLVQARREYAALGPS